MPCSGDSKIMFAASAEAAQDLSVYTTYTKELGLLR